VPENLESLEIPSQNYVRVIAKGAMTECITKLGKKFGILKSNENSDSILRCMMKEVRIGMTLN